MLDRPKESRVILRQSRDLLKTLKAFREPRRKLQAEKLLSCYEKSVERAIQDLKIGSNPVLWACSPEEKQKRALSAFNYLFDVITIGLGPEVQKLSEK